MNNIKILRDYETISSLRVKRQRNDKKNETIRTLNEINLIPAKYDNKEVYINETKKETTGGNEKKIRVIYY